MENEFYIDEYINYLENAIYRAMIMEVGVTPKPGLVDLDNNGSHKDMNFSIFRRSATVLKPHFHKILHASTKVTDPSRILLNLRDLGLSAENAMYAETGQINTHKGMIFNLGMIASVIACLSNKYNRILELKDIKEIRRLIKINAMPLDMELSHAKSLTNGIKQYQEYGVGGARGEALSGYETVFEKSLPYLIGLKDKHLDLNTKLIAVLLKLITSTEDSNLMKRGGIEGSNFLINESLRIIELLDNEDLFLKEVALLDKSAIKMNLSPGGSADLLCVTIFCALIFKVIK